VNPESRTLVIPRPLGGWFHPWPNVFELATALPVERWTLVGGLMVQAHALARGIASARLTEDIDVLLKIELSTSVITAADRVIARLGYALQDPADERRRTSPHYRYKRASSLGTETIDVMAPDHAPPRVVRRLRGRPMFEVEGGTQAIGRTMTFQMETDDGAHQLLHIPDELGALVLKGAAYSVDRRARERHLTDAAILAACIHDHAAELERLGGSDRRRLHALARALADRSHPAWLALTPQQRLAGQDTLRILTS
jgi:hypothetical protein